MSKQRKAQKKATIEIPKWVMKDLFTLLSKARKDATCSIKLQSIIEEA